MESCMLGDESWCTETGVSWGSGTDEVVVSGTAEQCATMCADPGNDCKIYAWSPGSVCRLRKQGPYRREGPGDHPMMCSASDGAHVVGLEGWVSGAGTALPGARRGEASLLDVPCSRRVHFRRLRAALVCCSWRVLSPGASGAPPSFVDPVTVTTRPVIALPVFQMLDETGRPEANSKPWILGGVRFKGIQFAACWPVLDECCLSSSVVGLRSKRCGMDADTV